MKLYQPLLLLILFTMLGYNGKSQTPQSDFSMYQDTCLPTTVEEYDRLIRYFRENSEEKQLLKLNLLQLAYFDLDLSYERKLNKTFNLNASTYLRKLGDATRDERAYQTHFQVELKQFYPIFKHQNNIHSDQYFSGQYFSYGIGSYIYSKENSDRINPNTGLPYENYNPNEDPEPEGSYEDIVWKRLKYSLSENIAFVKLGYGYQYRFGKFGFLSGSLKMGLGTNYDFSRLYLMPEVEIKMSFAISTFRKNQLK